MLSKLFRKQSKFKIIVSGLPRSGTSLMMKMLEAGGLEIFTDNIRKADEDNPKGYYELERVKRLPEGDIEWLREAEGKVIKVISRLVPSLPDRYAYKVLFMRRNMEEILASQRKMLERRNANPDKIEGAEMARLFDLHIKQVLTWMDERPNFTYMVVDYGGIIKDPRPIVKKIREFLGVDLDLEEMVSVVDPELYRQRIERK